MTKKIYEQIAESLSGTNKKDLNVCVLGIGSDLRGDDAAGLIIADNLSRTCPDLLKNRLYVIYGSTAPENFTGEIKKVKPTHLVIVDCADMGLEPGEVGIVDEDDIKGVSFSTHTLPISIIVNYLKQDIDFKALVIGIQPLDTDFGSEVSQKVLKACGLVTDAIIKGMGE